MVKAMSRGLCRHSSVRRENTYLYCLHGYLYTYIYIYYTSYACLRVVAISEQASHDCLLSLCGHCLSHCKCFHSDVTSRSSALPQPAGWFGDDQVDVVHPFQVKQRGMVGKEEQSLQKPTAISHPSAIPAIQQVLVYSLQSTAIKAGTPKRESLPKRR